MTVSGKRTVFVTDGNSRAALAVTRSLGRAGYRVVVGERHQHSLAGASKYCVDSVDYPDPSTDEGAFLHALENAVRKHDVSVLLPVTDASTWLVAEHRARFERLCGVPLPDLTAIDRASDKAWVVKLALDLGIPVPHTTFLDDPQHLSEVGRGLAFPLVVKPRRSRMKACDGWQSARVSYAQRWDDLEQRVSHSHRLAFPLLLQERIEGSGVGLFTYIDRGEPVAWFAHRRIREKPPSGGVSVLCESIPVPVQPRVHAAALLKALQWQGVAMVEFKEDRRDGVWRLMEVNGRFWGSLQLAVDAGADFPLLVVGRCVGTNPAPFTDYRIGVRSRWWWGDVDSLLITLRTGRGTNGHGRGRTLLEFLKLWSSTVRYENPRWSDLGPWWHETDAWLSRSKE